MPQVSILMSVFREKDDLLKRSIQSLLAQELEDIEIIIVDDGMSDSNVQIINEFQDHRIKVIKNSENIGLTKSLNRAAKNASSNYLARLDSDDWVHEKRLSTQLKLMEDNKDIVLCGTKILETSGEEKDLVPPKTPFISEHLEIIKALSTLNPFAHSSLFIRTESFQKIKGYDPAFKYAQDYDLVFRISKEGKLHNIENVLVYRNIGLDNISHAKKKEQLYFALKTRMRAFFEYGGNLKTIFHLFKSLIVLVLPNFLIKIIQKSKL